MRSLNRSPKISTIETKIPLKLYIQYVWPHMEFASPIWSPWLEHDIQMLEKVKMKAVSMISGIVGDSYEATCKELNIDTL